MVKKPLSEIKVHVHFFFFLSFPRATATATPDPSCICGLQHSSQQRLVLNPLSEARDQTGSLLVASWICFHSTTNGHSFFFFFKFNIYSDLRSEQPSTTRPLVTDSVCADNVYKEGLDS